MSFAFLMQLTCLLRRYPKVEPRLRELVTSAQIGALLDGTIDLALLRDGDRNDGVEISTLLEERRAAGGSCTGAKALLARGRSAP